MSGLLGKTLSTNSIQRVAQLDPNLANYGSINILVVNPLQQDVAVELWISEQNMPTTVDMIAPGTVIPPLGTLEWNCRLISGGEGVFVRSAVAGMVVRVESADELNV